ncbi:hypothetical protein ACRDNQ_00815 [Palleronia sp. KMU-117]|uniref:hypothetical protein n=1 Tax=Palleronia sp. KMU-117 TaxID=3434108 RepID=UPI003D75BB1A
MPPLVRLYIRQTLVGFALAAVFVGLLFWFNVANLWHLVNNSSEGWLAAFLLFMFNGVVFSGVQFGISIMRMAEGDDDDPFGGKRLRAAIAPAEGAVPLPVPVKADAPRA